jgi:tetratricopeptide (TPR) repeat protein
MNISERARRILDDVLERESMSYEEILDEMSDLHADIEILRDIDNLVFFRFMEHVKGNKNRLKLRKETEDQMMENPKRVTQRILKIVYETPPWYRKLTVLSTLDEIEAADEEEIQYTLNRELPHEKWPSQIVNTSLRILEFHGYVSRLEKNLHTFTLADKGRDLLVKCATERRSELKDLEDELSDQFKTFFLLDIVRSHGEVHRGITTGRILMVLQEQYGRRGNNRRAVRNILNKMVQCGLLNVSETKRGTLGSAYTLGSTALTIFGVKLEENTLNIHPSILNFKETVEKVFEGYEIKNFPFHKKSRVRHILDFVQEYEQNMDIAPKDIWVSHIMWLYNLLKDWKGTSWGELETRWILGCILSRLLPPKESIGILKEYPPPLPDKEQYVHQPGIAREYYFNLTKNYLSYGNYEEAQRSFDHLEPLCWATPEFLVLKGRVEMLRCNTHRSGEFEAIIDIFREAERISKGNQKISVLFQKGLAYYRRGYFKEAEKTWEQCLKSRVFENQKIILNHNLANIYALSGDLEKARGIYEQDLEIARKLHEEKYVAYSLINLSDVLIDLCLWKKAEETLAEAIHRCEANQYLRAEALARAGMGNLLIKRKKYETALSYLEDAVKLADKTCDPFEYGSILIHIGTVFRKLMMVDEALDAYDDALRLISNSDLNLTLTAEIDKADLYIEKGDFERSLELSGAVLKEAWLDDRRSTAEAHRIQGKVYLMKKDAFRGRTHLEESEKIFKDLNLQYQLLEVYQLLERCCHLLHDEKETYYRTERETLQKTLGCPS